MRTNVADPRATQSKRTHSQVHRATDYFGLPTALVTGLTRPLLAFALLAWMDGCGNSDHPPSIDPIGAREAGDVLPERRPDGGNAFGAFDGPAALDDGGRSLNPLLGSWGHALAGCSYTHIFDSNGTYTISSTTGERITANYEILPPENGGIRWVLAFVVTFDNNVVDCEGDMIDETRNLVRDFVEFVGSDQADFYLTSTGGTPIFSLQRL